MTTKSLAGMTDDVWKNYMKNHLRVDEFYLIE